MVMRVGLDGSGLIQTPVDLVPGVEESLDRLAVAPGAMLVSGLQLPGAGSEIQRSAIAARLSRSTLQPLERALTNVPNAREGDEDVAAAPGGRRTTADAYVAPNDTQVFRAIPGTLGPDLVPARAGPAGARTRRGQHRPRVGGLRVTPVIRLDRRLPAVLACPARLALQPQRAGDRDADLPGPPGARWVPVRGARFDLAAGGKATVRFTGRISRRRTLEPGRYRVLVTAVDRAGNASRPAVGAFRLVRGRG